MGMVTTHTEGRVVTHSGDDAPTTEVVQLPGRDAAVQAAAPVVEQPPAAPAAKPPKASPAVKAAVKRQATRIKQAKKSKK